MINEMVAYIFRICNFSLSNTKSDKYSGFAFRISGSAIEDPKEDPENYDYRSYEDSYENDVDRKERKIDPQKPSENRLYS